MKRAREDSTRFPFGKPHRAAAAAPVAKNSPPDCFLDAPAQGFESSQGKERRLRRCEVFFLGAPERIRTPGTQNRNLVLYPAELRARVRIVL